MCATCCHWQNKQIIQEALLHWRQSVPKHCIGNQSLGENGMLYKKCAGKMHVQYNIHLFTLECPQLHKSIWADFQKPLWSFSRWTNSNWAVFSESYELANRKRKEKGYKTLSTGVSTAIADPADKQCRLKIMAQDNTKKEKAESQMWGSGDVWERMMFDGAA